MIRFRGEFPKGGFDVHDGGEWQPAPTGAALESAVEEGAGRIHVLLVREEWMFRADEILELQLDGRDAALTPVINRLPHP